MRIVIDTIPNPVLSHLLVSLGVPVTAVVLGVTEQDALTGLLTIYDDRDRVLKARRILFTTPEAAEEVARLIVTDFNK